jgi:hypothetical protein
MFWIRLSKVNHEDKKFSIFVLFLLPVFSFACSFFTPMREPDPTFVPVRDPLMIEPAFLPNAQKGVTYEAEIHITKNVTPVGDMYIKSGTLPAGLELVFMKGQDTANISGIPEETGTFSFKLYAWCFGT